MIAPIANFFLFFILGFFTRVKRPKATFAFFIIGIWTFSAFLGVFYHNSQMFRQGFFDVSFFPFFYLFICLAVALIPFLKQTVYIEEVSSPVKLTKYLMIFLGVIAIPPFIEITSKLVEMAISGQFLLLGANYDEVARGNAESDLQISRISWILVTYLRHLKIASLVLFFFYLQQEKSNKFILLGLFIASIVPGLANVTVGNRTEIVWFVLFFLSLYVLLIHCFPQKTRKFLHRIMLAGGIILLAIFMALSIGRYTLGVHYEGSFGVFDYLYMYTSESMYNFNTLLFHENATTPGYNTLFPIQQSLGLTDVPLESRRHVVQQYQSSPAWLFYSFIGDFYSDFGFGGTFIVISLISIVFSFLKIKRIMRLSSFILLSTCIYMVVNGLFYFCYKISYGPIYTNIILFIFFRCIESFVDANKNYMRALNL